MKKRGIIITAMMIGLLLLFPARVSAQTVTDISKQLICQCGCNAVLDNCTHAECMVREQMLGTIKTQLDQGKTEAEIISLFVARYGEQVLSSPPKRGFNLTAWILPFAAILAGGAIIYLIIKRWVRLGRSAEVSAPTETSATDEEYESRLENELKEFTMRGFR